MCARMMAEQKNTAQPLPAEVYDDYWISVRRRDPFTYPAATERCGKWMIYAHISEVNQIWATIRDAVEAGLLGSSAKVATMRPNPKKSDQKTKRVNDMTKVLRASVMRQGEWFKERDQEEWKRIRRQVLKRDNSTCVYCGWQAQRFMQVNHIGAEDNHSLEI